jgi:ferredoxin
MDKKAIILYFSGTGNTEYIVKEYQSSMTDMDWQVDIKPFEQIEDGFSLEGYTLIGIGFPVYAWLPPGWVMRKVNALPFAGVEQKAFIIGTAGGIYGNAAYPMVKALQKKGFEVLRADFYSLYDNFFPNLMRLPIIEELMKKRFEKVKITVRENVEALLAGEKKIAVQGLGCIGSALGMSLGMLLERKGRFVFSNKARVTDACVHCQLCYTTCPAGAIDWIDNKPSFNPRCIVCLRCYNICPTRAIIRFEQPIKLKQGLLAPGFVPPQVRPRVET